MKGSPLPRVTLGQAGSQACGSRGVLRPEVEAGRAPRELFQNLQASLNRSRPVCQTGAEAGNLGRGPGGSPGLGLVLRHLSAVPACWGSQGRADCPPIGLSLASRAHRPSLTLAPSQGTKAPRSKIAHLQPQDSYVAGLESAPWPPRG